jgi:DNA-binding beta-propeller fold protein YncE
VTGRVAAILAAATAAILAVPPARGEEARGELPGAPVRRTNPMPAVVSAGMFAEHAIEGWLASPLGLFFDAAQREVYVADTDGRLVGIFDPSGAPLFAFGAGLLDAPFAVAVDPASHHIYVLDQDRAKVKEFSFRGVPLGALKLPGLEGRKDVVLSALHVDAQGWLYVAENKLSEVFVYDRERKLVARFGTVGYDRGQFIAIVAITTDAEHVYVLDQVGTVVQVFDRRGKYQRGFGEHSSGPETFSLPSGLAVAPSGKIFVSDALRHEVKVFAVDGLFLGRFGGRGRAPGDLGYPGQLAFDGEGNLLVLEKINGRVQRFRVTEAAPAAEPPPDAAAGAAEAAVR